MMNIQNAYDQWADTYDADENFTRDLDKIVTENALKNLVVDTILEIGCGTGKNTKLLAQIGKTVHAIDYSEGMISKARSLIQANNVVFSEADLTKEWPIQDQSIDLIVCNLVLEHIEELGFIFGQAARSLRENGIFYISELHPFKQYQGGRANFRQMGKVIEIHSFVHHISDFLQAAQEHRLTLLELKEWWHRKDQWHRKDRWHQTDQNRTPRLITFKFEKL